ncbi:MAG: hypothetical protein EA401_12635 [Planctomycetota bacterium]|nr:MAG: hypothetical protein EA401_12635 [Planctomycetota bacterium]
MRCHRLMVILFKAVCVEYPCFIDFEASSLSRQSFPIAVAWNKPCGEIRRFLISPQDVPEWVDWDPASEAIHGLDRERLVANGWAPDYVCEEICHDLAEQVVWADAPQYDGMWLQALFSAAEQSPPFSLSHIENLLIPLLKRGDEMEWQAAARMQRLSDQLNELRHDHHDPGADVGYLMSLWEAAQGMPLRSNHRIGPIPARSASGTWMRALPRKPSS